MIWLNYDDVEVFLLRDHQAGSIPRRYYGITFSDHGGWGGGNYTLSIKIEKL